MINANSYIRTSYGSITCIRLYGYNLSSLNRVAPLLRLIRKFICLQIYIKIAIYKPMGIKKWEINSQIAIAFSFDGKSVKTQ